MTSYTGCVYILVLQSFICFDLHLFVCFHLRSPLTSLSLQTLHEDVGTGLQSISGVVVFRVRCLTIFLPLTPPSAVHLFRATHHPHLHTFITFAGFESLQWLCFHLVLTNVATPTLPLPHIQVLVKVSTSHLTSYTGVCHHSCINSDLAFVLITTYSFVFISTYFPFASDPA